MPEIYCHWFRCKVLTGKPSHFNLRLSTLSVELTENARTCAFSPTRLENQTHRELLKTGI